MTEDRRSEDRQVAKNYYSAEIRIVGIPVHEVKLIDLSSKGASILFKDNSSLFNHLPEHSTQISSNLKSDKHYDQIMFFPGQNKKEYTGNHGIFDFDGAIFNKLWQTKTPAQFRSFLRYYISDHRPMWAEFKI